MSTTTVRSAKAGKYSTTHSTVKVAVWKELAGLRAVAASMSKPEGAKKAKRKSAASARKK